MINKHRIKEEIESQILHWRQNYDLYGKEVDAAKVIGATWIYDLIRPLLDNGIDILDTSAVPISCFKFIRTLVEQRCVCDDKLSVMHLMPCGALDEIRIYCPTCKRESPHENHITVATAIRAFMIKYRDSYMHQKIKEEQVQKYEERLTKCPLCNGTGADGVISCSQCGGSGELKHD